MSSHFFYFAAYINKERRRVVIIYVVKEGDTLYQIARRYGVDLQKLIDDNQITDPDNLVVGENIVILADLISYTIVRGDTLYQIAKRYGISLQDLLEANPQISNPNQLMVGQVINIPVPSAKLSSMEVNGYVYDTIDAETLNEVLPNLTYISIFSYEVRPDGSLSSLNDQTIIDKALAQNVAPLLTITNIKEGGSFDSDLGHTILNDEQVQDTLIRNMIDTMQSKKYYGANVDFEYLYSKDREAYNQFLRKLTAALHPYGYIVTTALAPKISADQQGTLYEAHDYKAQGEIVDRIILMTYEWGYLFGPPLPIAPIGPVKQVLDYAVSVIPPQKILMGMPNYAYDWTLPYQEGTAASILTNVQAVELAREKGVSIEYDTESQAPYFTYIADDGKEHIVWFDNAQSIEARLKLVDEYGLAGVSYWTLNNNFPQNWLVQNALYNVVKVL